MNANNTISVVETHYLNNFTDFVDKYLKSIKSIPLFLAAVQIYENNNLEIEVRSRNIIKSEHKLEHKLEQSKHWVFNSPEKNWGVCPVL